MVGIGKEGANKKITNAVYNYLGHLSLPGHTMTMADVKIAYNTGVAEGNIDPVSTKPNAVTMIIGAIVIGLAIIAVGIWLLLFDYVTTGKLMVRVQSVKDTLIQNESRVNAP